MLCKKATLCSNVLFFNLYNFSSKNYLPVNASLAEIYDMCEKGEVTSNWKEQIIYHSNWQN